jgi:hypothetical protein
MMQCTIQQRQLKLQLGADFAAVLTPTPPA